MKITDGLHEDLGREAATKGSSDRAFGLVFAALFGLIGLWPLLAGGGLRWWSLGAAAVFTALALARPRALAPLNRLWTRGGLALHRLVSPLVMALMFYFVVTPIGLVMRLAGKDPLRLKLDAAAPSYWIVRQPPGPAPDGMKNQF